MDGLRGFLDYLASRTDASKVKSSVERTLRLVESCRAHYSDGHRITTLDRLTKWIEEQYKIQCNAAFPRKTQETEWPFTGQTVRWSDDLDKVAHAQVLDAKLATSAWFLHLEDAAFTKPLQGYEWLLREIFGHGAHLSRLGGTTDGVLTFNYDRLFEIAVLRLFADGQSRGEYLYAPGFLNSGCQQKPCQVIEINAGRFCFLKLHGSVAWRVRRGAGNRELDDCRCYDCCFPVPGAISVTDSGFVESFGQNGFEPLLVFPHEKHRGRLDFHADPYIDKIWKQAARLISEADEVKILGYSFDPVDRQDVIQKLFLKTENCRRVLVLGPRAPDIVKSLKDDLWIQDQVPQLLEQLIPCRCNFGERFDLP